MEHILYKDLDDIQQNLLTRAKSAMEKAYNPYSQFYVGAALLSTDGQIIAASNVENAAYGSTLCAERAAIVKANSQEIRRFSKVALIGRGETFDTNKVTSPCGGCRQVLYEFSQISDVPLEIIMATTKMDKIVISSIDELLPLGFGPRDLGVDIQKYQT